MARDCGTPWTFLLTFIPEAGLIKSDEMSKSFHIDISEYK